MSRTFTPAKAVPHEEVALVINGVRLPYRNVDVECGHGTLSSTKHTLRVPRGIARNNRSSSWQLKIVRNGKTVVSGNVADGADSPESSLKIAIQMVREGIEQLGEEQKLTTLKSAGHGSRVRPFRLTDGVTLHWKLINTTPSLYAQVYSPLQQKAKSVNVCSDRTLEKNPIRLRDRVAYALVWADRVARESDDPFAPVTFLDIQPFLGVAAELVSTHRNPALKDFLEAGQGIREKAEIQRDGQALGLKLKSTLALKALTSRLA